MLPLPRWDMVLMLLSHLETPSCPRCVFFDDTVLGVRCVLPHRLPTCLPPCAVLVVQQRLVDRAGRRAGGDRRRGGAGGGLLRREGVERRPRRPRRGVRREPQLAGGPPGRAQATSETASFFFLGGI